MSLFYAETGLGCCVREARNIDVARSIIRTEIGAENEIIVLREATDFDVDWIYRNDGQLPVRLVVRKRVERAYRNSEAICNPYMIFDIR